MKQTKYWQGLAWDCYTSFFLHLYQSYGSISWEQILLDRISPNLIYVFTLTRSSIGLIHIIFHICTELWPLMYSKISFPPNILRTIQHIFTKFYTHWYWQVLPWHCYTLFFRNLDQRYCPLFTPKCHFCSISWVLVDRNFQYAFILTKFSLLQSYGPLLVLVFIPYQYLQIFLLNIFRTWAFLLLEKRCCGALVRFWQF